MPIADRFGSEIDAAADIPSESPFMRSKKCCRFFIDGFTHLKTGGYGRINKSVHQLKSDLMIERAASRPSYAAVTTRSAPRWQSPPA